MNIFVTFSSTGYEWAKERICKEALKTGFFNKTLSFNEKELSPELQKSEIFKIKKGLGYYSWKPDTLWQAILNSNEGDIIVYCDAGCVLQKSTEWNLFARYLEEYDIITFRIHQPNYKWTRSSVIKKFANAIKYDWVRSFQMGANCVIVKNSAAGRSFIKEWRECMLNHLDLCGDVPIDELLKEDSRFIENRYDQTILTALSYKYREKGDAYILWEHFEGADLFRSQAILAARLRNAKSYNVATSLPAKIKCFVKQYIYYPYLNITFKL